MAIRVGSKYQGLIDSAPSAGCLCHTPAFARLNALVTQKISRRSVLAGAAAGFGAAAFGASKAFARIPDAPKSPIAFTNARVFDGMSATVRTGLTVIVEGNKIKSVDTANNPPGAGFEVIDCGGRTLMPGLIDAHVHAMMSVISVQGLMTADIGYINLVSAEEAEKTLMRGFTGVRDMAGPVFGLKRAIDSGIVPGPRIWPSGAMISQTSGHGDFRLPSDIPAQPAAPLTHPEVMGAGMVADGVPEVLKRVREQLMLGATQIKLAAGGGVASNYDPLDSSQYTEAEFQAACEAAANWGTYVAVHAYMPRAIQTAVRGGVRCIEHGQLMDEETAKILADKGIWLSAQPFLGDEDANVYLEGSPSRAKQLQVSAGTDRTYGLAKKYKLKTAWGTDTLHSARLVSRQGAQLAKMKRWYSNAEVLRMGTSVNAELLAMSGPRNPYPGKLGVIETGAYADMLLVNGDPLADIDLIADPERNFAIIMKDGRFYKNMLRPK